MEIREELDAISGRRPSNVCPLMRSVSLRSSPISSNRLCRRKTPRRSEPPLDRAQFLYSISEYVKHLSEELEPTRDDLKNVLRRGGSRKPEGVEATMKGSTRRLIF